MGCLSTYVHVHVSVPYLSYIVSLENTALQYIVLYAMYMYMYVPLVTV